MIPDNLIRFYTKLFVNCDDRYAVQVPQGGYKVLYEPTTTSLIAQHLEGAITLGFPAMSKEFTCKWAAWDADNEAGDLFKIKAVLERLGLRPLREGGRPGRDGHLWLFFDRPIAASRLRRFDLEIRAHAQVAARAVEFFPKQDSFDSSPNPVRGPLGINRKPEAKGARGLFAGAGSEDLLDQLGWLAHQPLNSADHVEQMISKIMQLEEQINKYVPERVTMAFGVDLDPELVFADLNPEPRGNYFICDCPECGQREAYFYSSGWMLHCNRLNKCGFKISMQQYADQG
jgi:hypothetical protein